MDAVTVTIMTWALCKEFRRVCSCLRHRLNAGFLALKIGSLARVGEEAKVHWCLNINIRKLNLSQWSNYV